MKSSEIRLPKCICGKNDRRYSTKVGVFSFWIIIKTSVLSFLTARMTIIIQITNDNNRRIVLQTTCPSWVPMDTCLLVLFASLLYSHGNKTNNSRAYASVRRVNYRCYAPKYRYTRIVRPRERAFLRPQYS